VTEKCWPERGKLRRRWNSATHFSVPCFPVARAPGGEPGTCVWSEAEATWDSELEQKPENFFEGIFENA
jgi:hypothetical protein